MKPLITHAELLDNYKYTPETGIFFNRRTGKRIGFYDKSCNKRKVNIENRNYAESRLAVFYVTGKWPVGFVKSTSKRKAYNTKLKDLSYKIEKTQSIEDDLTRESLRIIRDQIFKIKEPKKPTYFQSFLSMFGRL